MNNPGVIGSGRPRRPAPNDNWFNPWHTPYPFPIAEELLAAMRSTSPPILPLSYNALPPRMARLAREAGPNRRLPNPGEKVPLVLILECLSLHDLNFARQVCRPFRALTLDIIKSRIEKSTIVLKGFFREKDISLRFSQTFGPLFSKDPYSQDLRSYICWTEMDDALWNPSARSTAMFGFRQIQPIELGGTLEPELDPPRLGLIQRFEPARPGDFDQDPPHQFVNDPQSVFVHFEKKPGWHAKGTLCRCLHLHIRQEESEDPEFFKWWEGCERNNQLRVVMPVYLLIAMSVPTQTERTNYRWRLCPPTGLPG